MTTSYLPRRAFLQFLGVFAAACSDNSSAPPEGAAGGAGAAGSAGAGGGDAGSGGGEPPAPLGSKWDLLAELKRAVQASPDHLPAAAAALVAAKDAPGLFALVRDRISTVPFTNYLEAGYDNEPARLLAGPRATLETGEGSVRDKVQLLHELLVKAGFDSKVVLTDYVPTEAETAGHFARKAVPELSIAVSDERVQAWLARAGVTLDEAPTPPEPIDPLGTEAIAVADALLAKVPFDADTQESLRAPTPIWRGPTPAVAVTVDGAARVLQPLRPDAAFDKTYGEVVDDAPPATSDEVVLQVEGIWSDDLQWKELVRGTWPQHQLAGRQVSFSAMPLLPPEQLLNGSVFDTVSYRPLLGLERPDGASDVSLDGKQDVRPTEGAFAGDGFTIGGDSLTVASDGAIEVNGRKLITPGEVGPIDQVKSLVVSALPLRFPRIELQVRALDAAGAPVTGLGSGAFVIREGEGLRTALLRSNSAARRVLVLIDASLSMPGEYLGDAGQALLDQIRGDLVALDPTMEVQADFTNSDVWTALASGSDAAPGAIVFVTDGDVTDAKTAAIEAALKAGPRACLIDVTPDIEAELVEMASLTKGEAVSVASPAEARAKAVAFLKDTPSPGYVLTYDAELTGPTERVVSLTVGASNGSTTYAVPPVEERLLPRRLLGVRVLATIGGTTRTRSLFGYDSDRDPTPTPAQVVALSDELRLALRSSCVFSFDAEQALPAVVADQALDGLLGFRSLEEALDKPGQTLAGVVEVFRQSRVQLPTSRLVMQARMPSALAASTFAGGIGMTMHVSRLQHAANPDQVTMRSATDIFSLPRHRTIGSMSGEEAFRSTVRAAVFKALVESKVHGVSTLSELAGKELLVARPYDIPEPPAGMPAEEAARLTYLLGHYGDSFRLYAKDGSTAAMWVIDKYTGDTFALLGDGSGGSIQEEKEAILAQQAALNKLLDVIGLFATAFGAAGVGAAVSYAQFQVALWTAATIAVLGLDVTGLDEATNAAFRDAILAALGSLLNGPFGAAFSVLTFVYGKM